MTDHNCIVKLNALVNELLFVYKVQIVAYFFHSVEELGVVGDWKLDTGEKVGSDTQEKGDVIGGELRDVHIVKGTQTDEFLWPI